MWREGWGTERERGRERKNEEEEKEEGRGEKEEHAESLVVCLSFRIESTFEKVKMYRGHLGSLNEWADLGSNMRWLLTIDIE